MLSLVAKQSVAKNLIILITIFPDNNVFISHYFNLFLFYPNLII
jgi:hypothetical protein